MNSNQTSLERAFDIAASGAAGTVSDIRGQLNREGYDGSQIEGPSLAKQLRQIIEKAKDREQ